MHEQLGSPAQHAAVRFIYGVILCSMLFCGRKTPVEQNLLAEISVSFAQDPSLTNKTIAKNEPTEILLEVLEPRVFEELKVIHRSKTAAGENTNEDFTYFGSQIKQEHRFSYSFPEQCVATIYGIANGEGAIARDSVTIIVSEPEQYHPDTVHYEFINGTLTSLALHLNSELRDTLDVLDTLRYWELDTCTGYHYVQLNAIVPSRNSLTWYDTVPAGDDFSRRYYVGRGWFLLGITNNTDKDIKRVVVSNSVRYDSSAVFVEEGDYRTIGYFAAAESTYLRAYFYSATKYLYWPPVDTRSEDSEAIWVPFTASGSISKQRSIRQFSKENGTGTKRNKPL